MNFRTALLLGLSFPGAMCAGAASAQDATPEAKPFVNWSDNSLTLLAYGTGFVVDASEQTTVTYEHVSDSKIGDLFIFVDGIEFHGTPDWYHGDPKAVDDRTWYGEISPRLSFGKMLGKDVSFPLVKDVLIAGTYERGEDADVSEAALVGVGFDLDVGKTGMKYAQLNIYGRNELTEGARGGMHDVQVTFVAARPFSIGKAQFLVDGYFDWVLGLGSEGWNYHLNPQVSLDVGNLWNKPGKFYAGAEVDFWWNKYQIPNSAAFDTNQSAISLMFKYHL